MTRPTRAHPRSRGENNRMATFQSFLSGASPLTRGKPKKAAAKKEPEGRIPAHAGKTLTRPPRSRTPRAHPRSRGENISRATRSRSIGGASPLTRGKLNVSAKRRPGVGRIPAHAGKTIARCGRTSRRRAHPRSRGENAWIPVQTAWMPGASPLTRGKPHDVGARLVPFGRIPAHAGKTGERGPASGTPWAHPRSRGENQVRAGRDGRLSGASPLTRGKPPEHGPDRSQKGRIPAHAGKTLPDLRFYRADRSDLGKP